MLGRFFLFWCSQQESNLHLLLRRELSYPLNDESVVKQYNSIGRTASTLFDPYSFRPLPSEWHLDFNSRSAPLSRGCRCEGRVKMTSRPCYPDSRAQSDFCAPSGLQTESGKRGRNRKNYQNNYYIHMSPQVLKYALDIVTLLLGVYIVVRLSRSGIGGTVGIAFKLILLGILVLGVNHLLDTAYFAAALKAAGHTTDYLQAPIVHRAINFIGFVLMTFGFQKLVSTPK